MKERGDLITNDQKLANLFNTHLINNTENLQLKKLFLNFQSFSEIISFYEIFHSLSKVKENNIISKQFYFK